jgi:hypothetical protein
MPRGHIIEYYNRFCGFCPRVFPDVLSVLLTKELLLSIGRNDLDL